MSTRHEHGTGRRQVARQAGVYFPLLLLAGMALLLTAHQAYAECTQVAVANGGGCSTWVGVHGISAIAEDGDVATKAWRAAFFPSFTLKRRTSDWWFHVPVQSPKYLNDVPMRFISFFLEIDTSNDPSRLVTLTTIHVHDGSDLIYAASPQRSGIISWGVNLPSNNRPIVKHGLNVSFAVNSSAIKSGEGGLVIKKVEAGFSAR